MKLRLLNLAVALLISAGSADAITISFSTPPSQAAAEAAEAAFLATLAPGYVTESFEGFSLPGGTAGPGQLGGLVQETFTTSIGDFTQMADPPISSGQACAPVCGDGLAILSASTSPYDGRDATTGEQWLDSNDAAEVLFTLVPKRTGVGFFLTDINDVGGRLTITAFDGSSVSRTFGDGYLSGAFAYVSITDPSGIETVTFQVNGSMNDGFGIDDVTVGDPVPEPGTLLLLGGGLIGLGARFRRR